MRSEAYLAVPMRDWSPFKMLPRGKLPQRSRSIHSPEGIADRLRAAAFAEVQARDAFLWAADQFKDTSPEGLCDEWRYLAQEEQKHLNWLLERLAVLGFGTKDRAVSDHLWVSLVCTTSAKEFSHYMAGAEERGRMAGEKFYTDLEPIDAITAGIFKQIAFEERSHVELALKHYPDLREILLARTTKTLTAASSRV